MFAEQAPRIIKEPKLKKEPESEIILAEGIPAPVLPSPSFENAQAFFSALSFPIDLKNPPKPFRIQIKNGTIDEQEVRNWEILGKHLGTGAVLEETGANYRITRERTRQIVEELVVQSYDAAPAALKEAFPRASLATKKPDSFHKSIRRSEAHGGRMREVRDAVLAGKSNAEIQKETGASIWVLSNYRSKGIAVPYLAEALGKEYRENLYFLANGLFDDRRILEIFEDIEKHNRLGVSRALKKAGVLVPLGKAARGEGVFINRSESAAYRFLKKLGIPVLRLEYHSTDKNGEQQTPNYFFVLNNHERTIGAFAHSLFDEFRTDPVEVLGRVSDKIPTTNIENDDAYMHVGRLLKERGIPIRPDVARKYLGYYKRVGTRHNED